MRPAFAHDTPRLRRGVILVLTAVTCSAGCIPSQIRSALPVLSTTEASYAGQTYYWVPRWYRLFSILPGARRADCTGAASMVFPATRRSLALHNCNAGGMDAMHALARRINEALDQSETRLGSIHVSRASYTLIREDHFLLHRSTQWLRPMDLTFDIAVRYQDPITSAVEIAAVRSTAHEIYHLWNRALLRPTAGDRYGRSEEMRAALFESCIEMAVFGAIHDRATDLMRQPDPSVVEAGSDLRASLQGNTDATGVLASIAGTDGSISSPEEVARMDQLCGTLSE